MIVETFFPRCSSSSRKLQQKHYSYKLSASGNCPSADSLFHKTLASGNRSVIPSTLSFSRKNRVGARIFGFFLTLARNCITISRISARFRAATLRDSCGLVLIMPLRMKCRLHISMLANKNTPQPKPLGCGKERSLIKPAMSTLRATRSAETSWFVALRFVPPSESSSKKAFSPREKHNRLQ